jgi:hypothetical protein
MLSFGSREHRMLPVKINRHQHRTSKLNDKGGGSAQYNYNYNDNNNKQKCKEIEEYRLWSLGSKRAIKPQIFLCSNLAMSGFLDCGSRQLPLGLQGRQLDSCCNPLIQKIKANVPWENAVSKKAAFEEQPPEGGGSQLVVNCRANIVRSRDIVLTSERITNLIVMIK